MKKDILGIDAIINNAFKKWTYILTESILSTIGTFMAYAAFFGYVLHWYSDTIFLIIIGLSLLRGIVTVAVLKKIIERKKKSR